MKNYIFKATMITGMKNHIFKATMITGIKNHIFKATMITGMKNHISKATMITNLSNQQPKLSNKKCLVTISFDFENRVLDLYLTYAPLSLFKWQMYESQRMRKKWFSVLGDEFEDSEEDQDSMKVWT